MRPCSACRAGRGPPRRRPIEPYLGHPDYNFDYHLDVGEDTGTPVNLSYDVPFRFTGTPGKVAIELK